MVLLVPRTTREWLSTKGNFFFLGLSVSLLYFWTTRGAGWKSSFWKVCPEWRVQLCSDSSPGLKWNQRCFSSRLPVIFALCKYTVLHLELTKKQIKKLKRGKTTHNHNTQAHFVQSWADKCLLRKSFLLQRKPHLYAVLLKIKLIWIKCIPHSYRSWLEFCQPLTQMKADVSS